MKNPLTISEGDIQDRIYRIRGQQVMLDLHLASGYGVPVGRMNEAIRRNIRRFPPDFMFHLTPYEWSNLKSQYAISSSKWGGRRSRPLAFTEHGIAMLSSVLRSPAAIDVNIAIIRAFIKLRRAVLEHRDLGRRIEKIEGRLHMAETGIRFMRDDIKKLNAKPNSIGPQVKGFEK